MANYDDWFIWNVFNETQAERCLLNYLYTFSLRCSLVSLSCLVYENGNRCGREEDLQSSCNWVWSLSECAGEWVVASGERPMASRWHFTTANTPCDQRVARCLSASSRASCATVGHRKTRRNQCLIASIDYIEKYLSKNKFFVSFYVDECS